MLGRELELDCVCICVCICVRLSCALGNNLQERNYVRNFFTGFVEIMSQEPISVICFYSWSSFCFRDRYVRLATCLLPLPAE